jgi:GntR family transcriptional regulator
MVLLDYRDARPIYTQIIDGFREQIVTGILQSGEKLPSVRELAQQITINPNTIQRAYRELEAGGWIVTVPGKGCFVNDRAPTTDQRQQLLAEFDRITAALIASGVSREDLVHILMQGGNEHA